jgi:hypothetical protein
MAWRPLHFGLIFVQQAFLEGHNGTVERRSAAVLSPDLPTDRRNKDVGLG